MFQFSCMVCFFINFFRLLAPEIFIPFPGAYGTKNRGQKPTPENGVDLLRRFLERVSCVQGEEVVCGRSINALAA